MPRVYVDSCVLLLAFKAEENDVSLRAIEELDCEEVEYLYSRIVELEVLPMPRFHRNDLEVEFMQAFFESAERIVCEDVTQDRALEVAGRHGLSAADALHVACAIEGGADELVTAEKLVKPLGRQHGSKIDSMSIRTIRYS